MHFIRGIFKIPELRNKVQKLVYTIWLLLNAYIVVYGVAQTIGDPSNSNTGLLVIVVGIVVTTFLRNLLLKIWGTT